MEDLLALHVMGPDRPGITSSLAALFRDAGARGVDLGQTVLHGHLSLTVVLSVPKGSDCLRRALLQVHDMGLRLEVSVHGPGSGAAPDPSRCAFCVTMLGDLADGRALAEATGFLAARGFNIREIRTLSRDRLAGIELLVDLPPGTRWTAADMRALRGEILAKANALGADMAVQRDGPFRRNKRLICLDVDSTFIRMEVIDELARMAGVGEEVAKVTEAAMRGELDFQAALRQRVALLKGLPMERAQRLLDDVPLTPGADRLVAVLKALGLRIGLVSGGFTFFVEELKRRFGLDFAFANTLEVEDGLLTGRVKGLIVDADRKAQVVADMAQVYGCSLEQCVAVGDGANDMGMLRLAGLGIAFRARPVLQQAADLSLNASTLDGVLYLMGFTERDLQAILGERPDGCPGA